MYSRILIPALLLVVGLATVFAQTTAPGIGKSANRNSVVTEELMAAEGEALPFISSLKDASCEILGQMCRHKEISPDFIETLPLFLTKIQGKVAGHTVAKPLF